MENCENVLKCFPKCEEMLKFCPKVNLIKSAGNVLNRAPNSKKCPACQRHITFILGDMDRPIGRYSYCLGLLIDTKPTGH